MPMMKAPRQVSRRQELRRDVVATGFARVVQWYGQFRNHLIIAAIALLVIVFAGIGYGFYRQSQAEQAAELLGGIIRSYEQGDYQQALYGTEEQPGLVEIAEEYGGTDDGNLAAFYAADALFRIGEKEEALRFFERFDKSSGFVGASAYAGEAAVHEDLGNYRGAARLYERAAETFENPVTTPEYLLDAARNYETIGNIDAAREIYEGVLEDYPEAAQAASVEILLARLETSDK